MLNNGAIAVVGKAWLSVGNEERSLTNKIGSILRGHAYRQSVTHWF